MDRQHLHLFSGRAIEIVRVVFKIVLAEYVYATKIRSEPDFHLGHQRQR